MLILDSKSDTMLTLSEYIWQVRFLSIRLLHCWTAWRRPRHAFDWSIYTARSNQYIGA